MGGDLPAPHFELGKAGKLLRLQRGEAVELADQSALSHRHGLALPPAVSAGSLADRRSPMPPMAASYPRSVRCCPQAASVPPIPPVDLGPGGFWYGRVRKE